MVKLIYDSLILLSITFSVAGQTWQYKEGNDPFDGKYRTSYVIGKGYEFPYTEPMFIVNIYYSASTQPNIALTSVPSAGCDNNKVLIKFNDDPALFTPDVTASRDDEFWFLHFSDLPPLGKPNFNLLSEEDVKNIGGIIYIVPEHSLNPVIRDSERENSEIINVAQSGDTLKLLNYDQGTAFWLVMYRNKTTQQFALGFVKINYIKVQYSDNLKYSRDSNTSYIRSMNWAEVQSSSNTETEFEKFIRYIKTHSKMYVRISSDCVRSDFEFSLKGSSAAMNFIFKN